MTISYKHDHMHAFANMSDTNRRKDCMLNKESDKF